MSNLPFRMDGAVCTCGQIKDDTDIIACAVCGDACCFDCLTECECCSEIVCLSCSSKKDDYLCNECDEMFSETSVSSNIVSVNDRAYLLVDAGTENEVKYSITNPVEFIERTDIFLGERPEILEIKGLGKLKYKYRTILMRDHKFKDGFDYLMYADTIKDSTVKELV